MDLEPSYFTLGTDKETFSVNFYQNILTCQNQVSYFNYPPKTMLLSYLLRHSDTPPTLVCFPAKKVPPPACTNASPITRNIFQQCFQNSNQHNLKILFLRYLIFKGSHSIVKSSLSRVFEKKNLFYVINKMFTDCFYRQGILGHTIKQRQIFNSNRAKRILTWTIFFRA